MLGSLERASSDRADIRRSLSETSAGVFETAVICKGWVIGASCQAPESQEMWEATEAAERSATDAKGKVCGRPVDDRWLNTAVMPGAFPWLCCSTRLRSAGS